MALINKNGGLVKKYEGDRTENKIMSWLHEHIKKHRGSKRRYKRRGRKRKTRRTRYTKDKKSQQRMKRTFKKKK